MAIKKVCICLSFVFLIIGFQTIAQGQVTPPKEHFGFNIGDDYFLVNYAQMIEYWEKLTQESDRIQLTGVGRTAEGRTMWMAIITSPQNQKNLSRYKEISSKMALAEDLSPDEARTLAADGKAVVWIDGGLHASEVLGAQQLIELVYRMTNNSDRETLRILNDVILLVLCTNPDGMDLVSNWYMREQDPIKRTSRGLPRLYHKYIGHDNNRDFYMVTQPESEAVSRIIYREWFPQIVYNHHQTGPSGTVLFAPPFRDPFNYCFDPLVPLGIDLVGAAMHNRFVAENKPGATMREGARYSTWWNGGLRTTVYFHNMIGILTESIGNPTPMEIPFLPQKQLPSGDLPFPIAPQKWHFRQSIEYSITADMAILDLASKHREDFLYNIYLMGKNSIDKGNRDNWTICPDLLEDIQDAIKKDKAAMVGPGRSRGYPLKYYDMLHDPAKRDPRGFIIPSNQPDFLTATKFVNTLIKSGIFVHYATGSFEIAGKSYPEGSYIIKSAQAFRPHLMTMFEPQNHPDDIPYPGGPPTPTYDNAGWTLAYQMGIEFDRILDGFDGPFEKIEDFASIPAGSISSSKNASGYLLDHRVNDSFIAINRLLKEGEKIYRLKKSFKTNGKTYSPGTIYIAAKSSTLNRLEKLSKKLGLQFEGTRSKPGEEAFRLKPLRIGLWDQYGGSMSSGWVRWLLEQFDFPFEVVYPPTFNAGNLNDKYDVLLFVSGALPRARGASDGDRYGQSAPPDPDTIPEEYRDRIGRMSTKETIPHLLDFLKKGGTMLVIGSSTGMAYHAGLPVANALTEKLQDGTVRNLSRDKYFVPTSILQVRVDTSNPLTYGMPEKVDVTFSNSPVFRLKPEAALKDIHPVAWFENDSPLRSGWAWGQHYLEGTIAIIDATVGKGKLFIYGPEITYRGQPHGTFKFLFNGIYYGPSQLEKIR